MILGATKVILLGFDMCGIGTHWFGKHDAQKGLSNNTDYTKYLPAYNSMNPEKYGLKIINCTRETALRCFPRMTLKDALSE